MAEPFTKRPKLDEGNTCFVSHCCIYHVISGWYMFTTYIIASGGTCLVFWIIHASTKDIALSCFCYIFNKHSNLNKKHITPHANDEPLLNWRSSHFTIFPSSAMILLVVWSANGDGIVLLPSKANSKVNLLSV